MGQAAKKFENIKFDIHKDFEYSLHEMYHRGGRWQKKAEKIQAVRGRFAAWNNEREARIYPLKGLKETNKGESRIDHCVKYDLGAGIRLITVHDNGRCVLLYIGDHDQCDEWLRRNEGLRLSADKSNRLQIVYQSKSLGQQDTRFSRSTDYAEGKLWEKLSQRYFEPLFDGIPEYIIMGFKNLDSLFQDDELEQICEAVRSIDSDEKALCLMDVFISLRSGDIKQAKKQVNLYKDEHVLVENLSEKKAKEIEPGEEFFDFEDFDPDMLEHFLNTTGFKEWMLFLHPEQSKIVKADYNGPAKLAGVSGSGKTAIIVKRAIRLAKEYSEENILVVTLNKALANLIKELLYTSCPEKTVRERILVKSFWKLCKNELEQFEDDIDKRFNDNTWKRNETVDEIWDEYYFCEKNNNDAEVFYQVHQSLLARNVNARAYIKQEFDWIRSAFVPEERKKQYLKIDREGRSEPFTLDFRELMLKGLEGWEQKMEDIGVTDYTGLAARLHNYLNEVEEKYRCILVDELQDFGTMELAILRNLVPEKENDMFLCGDIAQQVYTKHHKITHAGINVIGRSQKIKQNYRNSREILRAGYEVLKNNVETEKIRTDDFEIIEPEYANFSTTKPMLVKANNLEKELGYALSYLDKYQKEDEKACISFAELSLHQVKDLGKKLDLSVLDSVTNIDIDNLFISDLDQTKGFEFDIMFVLNCRDGAVPNLSLPEPEWHRDICKLYVAMTRAKKELWVSYHHKMSRLFENNIDYFVKDEWKNHLNIKPEFKELDVEKKNRFVFDKKKDRLTLTGKEFLYTNYAIGMPREVQNKLLDLVTGKNSSTNGKTTEWPTVYSLYKDRNAPNVSSKMGVKTYSNFKEFVDSNV